jgi:hypothetical protein
MAKQNSDTSQQQQKPQIHNPEPTRERVIIDTSQSVQRNAKNVDVTKKG